MTVIDCQAPECSRLVFFGIGVFPTPEYARSLKDNPQPFVSLQLLEHWERNEKCIYSGAELREANTRGGLSLLALHTGMPAHYAYSDEGAMYRTQLNNYTYVGNGGFQLGEFLIEMYGQHELAWGLSTGSTVRSDFVQYYVDRTDVPKPAQEHWPHLMCFTAEDSKRLQASQLSSLFGCSLPRFYFRPTEQQLLVYAVAGYTDQEIAPILGVTFATVRKRWDSIYDRVMEVDHTLLEVPAATSDKREKCSQKRRRLLGYIRHHIEELRPYDRPK